MALGQGMSRAVRLLRFPAGGLLLPFAYVSTTGGYVFTGVCLFNFWGAGYPIPGLGRGVPHLRSGQGGTPYQVWLGGTSSQVWPGGYPIPGLDWGYPGYPLLTRSGWGTLWPGLDGIPPQTPPDPSPPDLGQGTPSDLGWGTPRTWDGVPHPPSPSIVSTSYVAGGMPLAFTQEDFLVFQI